jgi:hypothetical protein
MSKVKKFQEWAESEGAIVEVAQEDDGSGYTVLSMELPDLVGEVFEVVVNE